MAVWWPPIGRLAFLGLFLRFPLDSWRETYQSIYLLRQSGDCRSRAAARLRAVEEEVALAGVAGEGRGALELGAGLVEAAELFQEVAAHAGQEVVSPKRGLGG